VNVLIVVDQPSRWPLQIPDTEVVAARTYLTDPHYSEMKRAKVWNMCRSYGYQTVGYYVSLLAMARGHRPLPSVTTIQDLRQPALLRIAAEDLDDQLQKALARVKRENFELSVYFGRNLAPRYDRISQILFDHFPMPFLRASFEWAGTSWRLEGIRPIASKDIPESHREFVIGQAERFFSRRERKDDAVARYDLAILHDPEAIDTPSGPKALGRFVKAARKYGIEATFIDKTDFSYVPEFDALFIRETTRVNHHTWRFARRAVAEGLVAIDDPDSIVRCSNKVYQAELFERHKIATPKTVIVHRDNIEKVREELGLPCVLKEPDGAFSTGVVKAATKEELYAHLDRMLEESDLVVAQAFVSSTFDWRIGILDRKPLFACRYHHVKGHWKIQVDEGGKKRSYGKSDAVPLTEAPKGAVDLALEAANLIGDGLYGVDIKQVGDEFVVIEVNDNPNIDVGYEDDAEGDVIYDAVMRVFFERLERRGRPEHP